MKLERKYAPWLQWVLRPADNREKKNKMKQSKNKNKNKEEGKDGKLIKIS